MSSKEQRSARVGVILGNLDAPHAYELASGITHAAQEENADLLFFPGMFAKSYYGDAMLDTTIEYDYQNTAIFDYINPGDTDVLIISMGTIRYFMNLKTEEEVKTFLHKFDGIKCILLEDVVEGYPCITISNKSGIYQELKHLIVDHGYKKIGFVSGNPNNYDAQERLGVYLSIMQEYGLPVDSSMIGYGEFTEYVDDIVGTILDRNPDLEALAFANDMMAVGGYREIKRRGLEVGRDIAVTGFDDYIVSMTMKPPLTTVRVSPYQLGFKALKTAMQAYAGKQIENYEVESQLVKRSSCGCKDYRNTFHLVKEDDELKVSEAYVDNIVANVVKYSTNRLMYEQVKGYLTEFVNYIIEVQKSEIDLTEEAEWIMRPIRALLNSETGDYISLDKLFSSMNQFMQTVLMQEDRNEVRSRTVDVFSGVFGYITNFLTNDSRQTVNRYKKESWYATFITRDTMMYSADVAEALRQIMVKLKVLQFKNAYIYLYKEPRRLYHKEENEQNEMYLAAYFNEDEMVAFEEDERQKVIIGEEINLHQRKQGRCNIVSYNLFANEEQYGIIGFETEMDDFSFAYTLSLQIGSALKFLHLMRKQMSMQKALEQSLYDIRKKNDLLSQLSIRDEMTGLYNRRGLFEKIADEINEHPGSLAAIVFIDMDNLKSVNDIYGHNEGDYALKSIADILKNSFRGQDMIGRIGGDEFAAFAIIDEPELMPQIKKKIDAMSELLNATNGKPYYVEVSLGVKEFICRNGMNLNDILKEADTGLYNDKKNKRKEVTKVLPV